MTDTEILEYAKNIEGGNQAWIGKNPQFNMDCLDLENCTNFRLPSKYHGIYDTVWLFEKFLNEYHILSWKIILDETVRLLKKKGKLIIRTIENSNITIPMIKNFIGRNINLDIYVDYEKKLSNGTIFLVFKIERIDFEIYSNKSWTFAMLTSGKKDHVVTKFLESIRNNEPYRNQIIISGPKKQIYDKFNVEYLDLSIYRDDRYAEISRKKNDISRMALGENILIVHDRFYLSDTFFNDFEKYGYDFDFLATIQKTEDNLDIPSYCAVYEPAFIWGQPIDCRDFNILPDTSYINGGCMIFKTKTLKKIRFNNLIFWNQMEDVEIAQKFMSFSIIPRMNYMTSIIAYDDNSEKMSLNYNFDVIKNSTIFFNPNRANDNRKKLNGIISQDSKFNPIHINFGPIYIKIRHKSKFPYIGIRIRKNK